MTITIPQQLQKEEFRFIKLQKNSKGPIAGESWKDNLLKYNDKELLDHLEAGGNYGVVGGYGDLRILDIDNLEIANEVVEEVSTFTVRTPGKGYHLYSISNDAENRTTKNGEYRANNLYVVGPNCHAVDKKKNHEGTYTIVKDVPIIELNKSIKEKVVGETQIGIEKFDASQSGQEIKEIISLLYKNKNMSKVDIYNHMANPTFVKWNTHGAKYPQYRELTYEKACRYVIENPPKKEVIEEPATTVVNSQGKRLEFITHEELSKYKEEGGNNWIVEKFFRPKTVCIISGKRSTLKTWLSLNLIYSISNQKKFLDKYETKKCNILYIDRENGKLELQKRTMMTVNGLQILEPPQIWFMSETFMKLDSYECLKELEEFIKANDIKIIIADTYRRLISYEENSADQTSTFFVDMIKPLCERTGVCFVFLHHDKKGEGPDEMDQMRGSSDLANYADTIMKLIRKGKKLTISQTKQRSAKELEPFEIEIVTDEINNFSFKYLGQKTYQSDKIAQDIVDWVQSNRLGQFSYSQVMNMCREKRHGETNVKEALREMINAGVLSKGTGKFDPYVVSSEINR